MVSLDPTVGALLFLLLGCLLGSFGNVVILRLPKGESVVYPRSRCPHCRKNIAFYDNIPVISWLMLGGRCRSCKTRISWRYPLVEALTGFLFLALYLLVGPSWKLLEYAVLTWGLVTVSFIDLDHRIIPDAISLPGIVLGLLGGALGERGWVDALLGMAVGGGFLWAVAYVYWIFRKEEGMGGGDIKLLAWIGSVLGWTSVPYIILSSSLLGAVVGLGLMVRGKGLKTAIPFGPFLALAALTYVFGGQGLANWYITLFFPWLASGS